jgi:replicative DNA helicase
MEMTPPDWSHSIEAEQSVLGALMLDNVAFDRVADLISERDFYTREHRAIFRAIAKLIDAGKGADVVTVTERLTAENAQEFGKVASYLGMLAQETPSALNIRRYAELVRERSILRRLFGAAQDTCVAVANFGGRDAGVLLDEAQARIMEISEHRVGREDFQPASQVLAQAFEFIDHQYHRDDPNAPTGVPTGFIDLDSMTSGLHPGQLVILAARPAMGKSALALNITEHAASVTGKWALFFTLEMGNREQALRMIAAGAGINVQRLVTGRLYDEEWSQLSAAVSRMHDLPIAFNEQAGLTVMELRALARRAMREHPGGLSLVVVDYLQLMLASDNEANRAMQLAEISRGLKLLAKELQVPVIALSQLNRDLEKRTNKRPVMSDLRDSGALEQDADVILFIYRDEVYNASTEYKGSAEIIICKQRNGPVGMVRLAFRADHTRFENYAGHDYS